MMMERWQTSFDPQQNGFAFPNRFMALRRLAGHRSGASESNLFYGLCGGICFAALDYYYADKSPSREERVPVPTQRLWRYLVQRQWASIFGGGMFIKLLVMMLATDRNVSQVMQKQAVLETVQTLGRGEPAVLVLIHTPSVRQITQNHQVIAYSGRSLDDGCCIEFDIYDPNTPHRSRRLSLHYKENTGSFCLEYSGGYSVMSFFPSPAYRRPHKGSLP